MSFTFDPISSSGLSSVNELMGSIRQMNITPISNPTSITYESFEGVNVPNAPIFDIVLGAVQGGIEEVDWSALFEHVRQIWNTVKALPHLVVDIWIPEILSAVKKMFAQIIKEIMEVILSSQALTPMIVGYEEHDKYYPNAKVIG
jgi:hypothetical protein